MSNNIIARRKAMLEAILKNAQQVTTEQIDPQQGKAEAIRAVEQVVDETANEIISQLDALFDREV